MVILLFYLILRTSEMINKISTTSFNWTKHGLIDIDLGIVRCQQTQDLTRAVTLNVFFSNLLSSLRFALFDEDLFF